MNGIFRMAEDYLDSELSLALDISREKVNEYIKERIMGMLLMREKPFDPSDTELLRALHSRNSKNIRNPLIFFKNGFLLMFLAGPKFKNPPASKLASDL